MPRRLLHLLAALVAVVVPSACRVDVAVDVTMEQNGSGVLTITLTADAEVVEQAPGLADDLRLDDLVAAGWTVDGPTDTADGGMVVAVAHTFYTPEQATALLATLNGTDGPFKAVAFSRDATERSITYTITGAARTAGLASFADGDLVAAVGATPYVDDIAAAGTTVDAAVGLTFSATLPGEVDSSTAATDDPPLTWRIPFDDSSVDLTTRSVASLERGGLWGVASSLALVALVAWIAASALFIAYVARARRRRRRRALRNL